MTTAEALIDERRLSKLKWRCRRGLLENDLFIERFFQRQGERISESQADAMTALMDLSDNDLLDLLLSRQNPSGSLDTPPVHALLALLKQSPTPPSTSHH